MDHGWCGAPAAGVTMAMEVKFGYRTDQNNLIIMCKRKSSLDDICYRGKAAVDKIVEPRLLELVVLFKAVNARYI